MRRAFTLVELLVVIVIVLLVSAVTLPAIISANKHREVSEAARILQGQLVQARDTAIRFNQARGVRFLPDPTYSSKPGTTVVAYNRMLPLEPGPDYSNGLVTVWPLPLLGNASVGFTPTGWVSPLAEYPYSSSLKVGGGVGGYYPCWNQGSPNNPTSGLVLMVEQAPFAGNDATGTVNAPTSWFWNVRVGDRFKVNTSGRTYTVVGPCTVNPFTGTGNPELFVNVGQPGDTNGYLQRYYTDANGNKASSPAYVEFLFLVNGVDDDNDGYIDNGWDGIDNNGGYNYNGVADDQGDGKNVPTEWEQETWQSTLAGYGGQYSGGYNTTTAAMLPQPMNYTIYRRPVPAQSARETMLPAGVVIDATTWNTTHERSRLPVDPFTGYVDIMVQPSGQVQPTTLYSSPSSFGLGASFYQFWLAERADVHEATDLWGPGNAPPSGVALTLPTPLDAYNAFVAGGGSLGKPPGDLVALTGERMLVTLFSRTGQLTNSSIEFFNLADAGYPFYDSQLGQREAK